MSLPSSMTDFVPRDRELQKAYCAEHVKSTRYPLVCLINNTDAILRGWFVQIETFCQYLPIFYIFSFYEAISRLSPRV